MESPAERRLLTDLTDARFLAGVAEGSWARLDDSAIAWPFAVFWVSAAAREGSPNRYHFKLEFSGYPIVAPTGTFWDPLTGGDLIHAKRPTGNGRVAKVFRIDWPNPNPGSALYFPYDRRGTGDHDGWKREMPFWVWDEQHSIVDVLSVLHELLNSGEYHGVRSPG